MSHWEKTIESRLAYDGTYIQVRVDKIELENGEQSFREIVERPDAVATLAFDTDNNIFLVRQFRYPYKEELLEIPAGKIDPNEMPIMCGMRELREETGYNAQQYHFLTTICPSPGYTNEIIYVYVATDLQWVGQHLDPDEFVDVVKIPFDLALEKCLSGDITDAKTIIAILKFDALMKVRVKE